MNRSIKHQDSEESAIAPLGPAGGDCPADYRRGGSQDVSGRLQAPGSPAGARHTHTQPINAPRIAGLEGFDGSAHRSRIVLSTGPESGDGQPFVSLGSPFSADTVHLDGFQRHGFLAREIIRQALLIAARDELGASPVMKCSATKPPQPRRAPSSKSARSSPTGRIRRITHSSNAPKGTKSETLADRTLPSPYLESGGILKLVDAAESLSRTEFPAALKKLGLDGKPHGVRADGTLSAEIEVQLSSLDFVEPFAAVRSLHE